MDPSPTSATPTIEPFGCVTSFDGRHATARLRGDLDLANAELLRDELLDTVEDGISRLSLDLSGLTFIDSSGVAALVVVYKRALERGVAIEVPSVSMRARRVLDACGLQEIFGL
jgi:anti-anti-sigma factor